MGNLDGWASGLLAVALVTVAVPGVADDRPACETVTDEEALAVGDAYARPDGEAMQVWEETNEHEGLQTAECRADGEHVAADEHVETLAAPDPDVPDVPDPIALCNQLAPGNMQCT